MTTSALVADRAEQAAAESLAAVDKCINEHRSFILEAGAGAGKTYSLIHALRYVIGRDGFELARKNQQIACITYTNAARDEIESRTDGNPVVQSSTIHSFCWSLLKRFQPELRKELPQISKWSERLEESGEIGSRTIEYDLGYPSAKDEHVVSLAHSDVLALMVKLLENDKFRDLLVARYPIIFVDEYQDTNRDIAEAFKNHFLVADSSLLLGFFGDHWQKIYGDGCGKIEHPLLVTIEKHANFRSVPEVVSVLNHIRPDLPQFASSTDSSGRAVVYHTNDWTGIRQTSSPWKGDLPPGDAHICLQKMMTKLKAEGWDFAPDKTKVLKLTHNGLADEQGYRQLANVFSSTDMYIRKEDGYIEFFADRLEPASIAYENRRYGEMFEILGGRRPTIRTIDEKRQWTADMDQLLELQASGSIGDVLDHLYSSGRPRLPAKLERREEDFRELMINTETERPSWFDRVEDMRTVPYSEVSALVKFINGYTPFATKHGVKGLEFENVLVVVGKGWNNYNFNQMLEWANSGVPTGKQDSFERSRNLFYVCSSRPKTNLAVLFTEELSTDALGCLNQWFGEGNVTNFQFS